MQLKHKQHQIALASVVVMFPLVAAVHKGCELWPYTKIYTV